MDFRLPGGVRRDAAVDAWLLQRPGELAPIALGWFETLRECGDDVRELLYDGCPVACVGDAPFAYVNAFTSHVNVGFFHGATLPDPAGVLQGSGKFMRHVTLRPDVAANRDAIRTLIAVAYCDIKVRLQIA